MLVFILSSKFNGNGSRNDSKGKKIEGVERVERKYKKRKEKKRKKKFWSPSSDNNHFSDEKSNKLIIMRMYFI